MYIIIKMLRILKRSIEIIGIKKKKLQLAYYAKMKMSYSHLKSFYLLIHYLLDDVECWMCADDLKILSTSPIKLDLALKKLDEWSNGNHLSCRLATPCAGIVY